jgi:Arc/MetJ-type ribon-helix-helix transcriptional regulator
MSESIRQAIQQLQSELEHHQDGAARLQRAIDQLRGLVDGDPAIGKPSVKTVKKGQKRAKKAKAATVKPTKANGSKPTLVQALQYVLAEQRKANGGGASAGQLYKAVQTAGYRFGGKNLKNNHTYLYKALRNPLFERVSKGLYALA